MASGRLSCLAWGKRNPDEIAEGMRSKPTARIGGDMLRRIFEVFTNSYGRFGARETLLGAARLGLEHMELGLWSVPAADVEPLPGGHPLSMIGGTHYARTGSRVQELPENKVFALSQLLVMVIFVLLRG